MPQVESAFVSVRPSDGAILSLVGGFDFDRNKFNHVTQALAPAGLVVQAVHLLGRAGKGLHARRPSSTTRRSSSPPAQTGGEAWEPKNYDGKFDGPMRLRTALAKSKNLVTVRVLQAIGPQYAQDYITRFGFDPKLHPAYLTMALGAGVGDAAADGRRLLRCSPTAATGSTPYLIDRDRRRPRQRAVEGRRPPSPATTPSARSIRATRSS